MAFHKRGERLLCWQLHFAFLLVLPLKGSCLDGSQGYVPYIFVSSCASDSWEITVSVATFRAGKGDDETNSHECQQTTCTLSTWDHSSDPQIAHCLQGKQHQQALVLLLGTTPPPSSMQSQIQVASLPWTWTHQLPQAAISMFLVSAAPNQHQYHLLLQLSPRQAQVTKFLGPAV